MFRFAIAEYPDVRGNAGVVEHIQRQGNDSLQPVVLDDPAADVALALPSVAGKERAAVVHLGDAAAQRGIVLHLAQHVGQEHHLAVAGAGDEGVVPVASVLHDEALVFDPGPAAHTLHVALPAFAVGGIGEHEVELMGTEGVGGEGGAILYVVGFAALALEDEIGLTDSVSLWVHFLAVQMDGDLLALLAGKLRKRLLGNCQHPACAARAVIDQICARPDLFGNRQEDEACHELHHVARG